MAEAAREVELFRSPKGTENARSIHLTLEPDFSLKMDAQDFGPAVEAKFGDGDYEFWYLLKPGSTKSLLVELIRDRFGGRDNGIGDFGAFLKERGIKADFGSWT